MKRLLATSAGILFALTFVSWAPSVRADDASSAEAISPSDNSVADQEARDAAQKELSDAKQSLDSMPADDTKSRSEEKSAKKVKRSAEAFVVGPDWEFDGFVAGGQDQNIKSMFVVNDLVYLNVGTSHGLHSGDRVGIYRRGDKIRDPQNSRPIGYEVRKIAISEVSDRLEDANCSARILKSYEAVEIGDLVRRED